MPDGTSRLSIGGQPILRYRGASTFACTFARAFASHILPPGIALAKVRPDAPFDTICCVGCGVTTGVQCFQGHASTQIASGIFGHLMGGNGALRHPGVVTRLPALAPICAPTRCGWGRKAFVGDLGADETAWAAHDASALMQAQVTAPYPQGIRIDQDEADKFLAEQLHPKAFEWACAAAGQPLALRRRAGYDHGYCFIASVVDGHLRHHARPLTA